MTDVVLDNSATGFFLLRYYTRISHASMRRARKNRTP